MESIDHAARARRTALAHTVALAVAALAGALCFPVLVHAAPATGVTAPDFALKDLAGRNQRLSEYRGDVVVLTFWASYCGPCRAALVSAEAASAASVADGMPVALGVSLDRDAARAASVAAALGLKRPPLLDADQAVGRLYDVQHLPMTLLIDREGIVRRAWARDPVPAAVLLQDIRELQP